MGIPAATTYPYPSLFSLGNMAPKSEGYGAHSILALGQLLLSVWLEHICYHFSPHVFGEGVIHMESTRY